MKTIKIIFLSITVQIAISCCDEGFRFVWNSMNASNIIFVTGEKVETFIGQQIPFSQYGFEMTLSFKRVSGLLNDLSFVSACAYSCESVYPNEKKIVAYSFTTVLDLNEDYPANSDISEILKVRPSDFSNYQPKKQFEDVDQMIYELNEKQYNTIEDKTYQFQILQEINTDTHFKVKIRLDLEDGTTITAETDQILLTK